MPEGEGEEDKDGTAAEGGEGADGKKAGTGGSDGGRKGGRGGHGTRASTTPARQVCVNSFIHSFIHLFVSRRRFLFVHAHSGCLPVKVCVCVWCVACVRARVCAVSVILHQTAGKLASVRLCSRTEQDSNDTLCPSLTQRAAFFILPCGLLQRAHLFSCSGGALVLLSYPLRLLFSLRPPLISLACLLPCVLPSVVSCLWFVLFRGCKNRRSEPSPPWHQPVDCVLRGGSIDQCQVRACFQRVLSVCVVFLGICRPY